MPECQKIGALGIRGNKSITQAPKLAASSAPKSYGEAASMADLHKDIKDALGVNGYRHIQSANRHESRTYYRHQITFNHAQSSPPSTHRPDYEIPYGNMTFEVYRGVDFDGEYGIETFKEEPGVEQDVPEVVGITMVLGNSPSSRDYADIRKDLDVESIPGFVQTDGYAVYVESGAAGEALRDIFDQMNLDRGEDRTGVDYEGMPHPNGNFSHPMELWPRTMTRPDSIEFEEHIDVIESSDHDPQKEVDETSVKTVITMPNGAQATYVSREAGNDTSFTGDWGAYGAYEHSDHRHSVENVLSEYSTQIDNDQSYIGQSHKAVR